MNTRAAVEAIFFQANSALGKGLERVFEEAIRYRDTISYSNIPDDKQVEYRYTLMHKYAATKLFPAMRKVIEDNTNVIVSKVVDAKSFSGYFAIDLGLDNSEAIIDIMENQTGQTNKPIPLDQSAREIADLSKTLDRSTGKFKSSTFGTKNRKLEVSLVMDVDMSFLMKDNLPHGYVESLTAQELTAIYLHEIGHITTILEYATDSYYQLTTIKDHLKTYRGASTDIDKFLDIYTKEIKPDLNDKVTKKQISKKAMEAIDAAVAGIEYCKNRKNHDYFGGIIESMLQCAVGFIYFILKFWLTDIAYSWCRWIWFVVMGIVKSISEPGDAGKTSDVAFSNRNIYHLERIADDFVARHGYGGHLSTGLNKITSAVQGSDVLLFGGSKVWTGGARSSSLLANYVKLFVWMQKLFLMTGGQIGHNVFDSNTYETEYNRLKRVCQQQKAAFKNALSPQAADHYLDQLELSMKELNETHSYIHKATDLLWQYILDIPMVLRRITQIDQQQEMEQLLNEMDDIINNDMYVHAAKFKQLARQARR